MARFRKVITEVLIVFLVLVLVTAAYQRATQARLSVRPVVVPSSMATAGYTPEIMAQRIATRMEMLDDLPVTRIFGNRIVDPAGVQFNVSPTVAPPTMAIQFAGQSIDFDTSVRFVLDTVSFGRYRFPDSVLVINVTGDPTSAESYAVEVRVHGGPYDGARAISRIDADTPETLVNSIALVAKSLAQPYAFGAYILAWPQPSCSSGMQCTVQSAREAFIGMLANATEDDDGSALLGLSSIALGLKDFRQAKYYCDRAIELLPDASGPIINCAHALAGLTEDRGSAINFVQATLEGKPRQVKADLYAALGDLYLSAGLDAQALEAYIEATKIYEEGAYAYIGAGTASRKLGRDHDSIADFYRRAVERAPNDTYALLSLGQVLLEQNRQTEALFYLATAYRLNPEDEDVREAFSEACREADENLAESTCYQN